MSKITNDGLTRSGAGCFIGRYPYGNSGRQRVNYTARQQCIIVTTILSVTIITTSWINLHQSRIMCSNSHCIELIKFCDIYVQH